MLDDEKIVEEVVEDEIVDSQQEELPKGKKEKTELPEGYEWRSGCKTCETYKNILEKNLFLPLDPVTNLCEPTGLSVAEKSKLGKRIDFWVRHKKTGKMEVVDKKWFQENQKKWDLEHIKMTSCRFRRIYQFKIVDEHSGKEHLKPYCAYWKKS